MFLGISSQKSTSSFTQHYYVVYNRRCLTRPRSSPSAPLKIEFERPPPPLTLRDRVRRSSQAICGQFSEKLHQGPLQLPFKAHRPTRSGRHLFTASNFRFRRRRRTSTSAADPRSNSPPICFSLLQQSHLTSLHRVVAIPTPTDLQARRRRGGSLLLITTQKTSSCICQTARQRKNSLEHSSLWYNQVYYGPILQVLRLCLIIKTYGNKFFGKT